MSSFLFPCRLRLSGTAGRGFPSCERLPVRLGAWLLLRSDVQFGSELFESSGFCVSTDRSRYSQGDLTFARSHPELNLRRRWMVAEKESSVKKKEQTYTDKKCHGQMWTTKTDLRDTNKQELTKTGVW